MKWRKEGNRREMRQRQEKRELKGRERGGGDIQISVRVKRLR